MLRAARFLADAVAALMFAAVFVIFCLKIGMRYVGHNELAWSDEIAIILFIWTISWANSFSPIATISASISCFTWSRRACGG